MIRADRRVVDRGYIHGERARCRLEIDPAVRHSAIVLHPEGKECIACAVGVCRRREFEIARGDVRQRDELARHHRGTVVAERARAGQGRYLHVEQRMRRAVRGVGKAEVGGAEGVRRVFARGHCIVRAGRCVVDRSDIDGHRARRRVKVDAAVRHPAIVLHPESERRIARAVGVCDRREFEIPRVNVGDRDELPRGNRHARKRERACDRQRRDFDCGQRIGAHCARRIRRIGKAEVRRGERVGRVFVGRHDVVRSHRRIVHRRQAHCHGARRGGKIDAAVRGAAVVLHLESE